MFDKPSSGGDLAQVKRVLLVRWDAKIGDSIVSSFFFRELRRFRPDICIDVITAPHMATLYQEHFGVDNVYCCKKRPSYAELKELASEIGAVDLVIHLGKHLKMKDIYFLHCLKASNVMGLDDDLNMVNIKLGEATKGRHFSEKFAYALNLLGISLPDCQYILPEDGERRLLIQGEWPDSSVIALNPYGSGSSRRLNFDSVSMLVEQIGKYKPAWQVCLMSTPDTKLEVEKWCHELGEERVFTVGCAETIQDAIEIVRLSDAVISVDTAIVHIASGLNKPLLGIYNEDEGNFSEWSPRSSLAVVVFARKDSGGIQNVNNIESADFEQALKSYFGKMIG
ncbi:glycosyltransferase family 9 protein [Oceanimonas pelagia]|uniref:Glycosyltransferase family 9 protein n=1 Tax=Oceanimonas pelagia TaxID=3028314 RepID=A0AA50KML1_9GAMM|nr:glycosyltransferase family 9 protein [Oceanimonas pelagia]WMC10334.1 glycosyltransferase family 9 protein [Oceanimonas pelagia]